MKNEDYLKAFKTNTRTRKIKDGYSCKCNLGLWGVIAPTKEQALLEGSYYFSQYYSDGEYD